MGKASILTRIKQWIAAIGFRLFIWGNNTTQEDYWCEIYEQERKWKKDNHIAL